MTKYFIYKQNNSGGYWESNANVSRMVIIEAHDADHANMIAALIGVDFNDNCDCCGYRWSRQDDYDSHTEERAIDRAGTWIRYAHEATPNMIRVYLLDGNGVRNYAEWIDNMETETLPL